MTLPRRGQTASRGCYTDRMAKRASWLTLCALLALVSCLPGQPEPTETALPPLTLPGQSVAPTSCGPRQLNSPYGVVNNQLLPDTPRAVVDARLDDLVAAGIFWLRLPLLWELIQPRPTPEFRYGGYDYIIRQARARCIQVLGLLAFTPDWAAAPQLVPSGADSDHKPPPASAQTYASYVRTTVARYGDQVAAWEVWNEPDLPLFWTGTAAQYAELLAMAYQAIKSVSPDAPVIGGALATGGPNVRRDFLAAILADRRYPAGQFMDILSIHINMRTPDDIKQQVQLAQETLARAGVSKPIWATEAQYPSDSAAQPFDSYREGEAGQARYLRDALIAGRDAGLARLFWWAHQDSPSPAGVREPGPDPSSGLLDVDARRKPAWQSYRLLIIERPPYPPAPSTPPNPSAERKST